MNSYLKLLDDNYKFNLKTFLMGDIDEDLANDRKSSLNNSDLDIKLRKYKDLNIFPEDSDAFLKCKIMYILINYQLIILLQIYYNCLHADLGCS